MQRHEMSDNAREARVRFGQSIRRRRMDLGLTASEVWSSINMHQGTYSELEHGRSRTFPAPELILELARVLETTSEELLREAGYLIPEEARQPEYMFTAMLDYAHRLPVDEHLREHVLEAVRFAEERWRREQSTS